MAFLLESKPVKIIIAISCFVLLVLYPDPTDQRLLIETQQAKRRTFHPIVFYLHDDWKQSHVAKEEQFIMMERIVPQLTTNIRPVRHRPADDPRTRETCEYMGEWQTEHHTSCMQFHEIHLDTLFDGKHELVRIVNNGGFRDVWMVRQEVDGAKMALKTLRFIKSRKFDLRNFDRHRRDALAFEQLASSPYVADIYGYCVNSALFDFCSEGDLLDIFDNRATKRPSPSKLDLLRIAIGVAHSVHDAHNFDDQQRPSIAHTDIKPDQWIKINGSYKLNDFNRARFMTWDRKRNEICPFEIAKNGGTWRSPEEYNYQAETNKVDIWSLGNVLYFLLTGVEPFRHVEEDTVISFVKRGKRPLLPEHVVQSSHPVDIALMKALDLCFVPSPSKRADASDVVQLLREVLHYQEQQEVVSIA